MKYNTVRGGSWYRYPDYLRVAYRNSNTPDDSGYGIGFRLVRSLDNCEVDKVNDKGSYRVLNGGFWDSDPYYLRAAVRVYNAPLISYNYHGFRLVRSIV